MEIEAVRRAAGEAAVPLVEDGMRVGLGTGSTAHWFVVGLAERVRSGLQIRAVATSVASALLAAEHGITVEELDARGLDLAVDGADAVDPALRLIKGRGGAMVREKIVAAAARRFVVVVDDTKIVPSLRGRVPVELTPFGVEHTLALLERRTGIAFTIRTGADGAPVHSDNGNLIADGADVEIPNPERLAAQIESIPGFAGHGLFLRMTELVLVGHDDGRVERLSPRRADGDTVVVGG